MRTFATEAADELARRDVKALVVACNTSTAVALRDLRARYDLPVLGVVRPGAAAASLATRNRRVGVIATPATVRSHAYFNAIKDENPAVEVYEHATPRLVPMVEAGLLSGPEVEAAIADELAPLLGARDSDGEFVFPLPASARIDTLLLGCTHYPLLRSIIAAAAGERVAIVDSATATASALAELLSVNGLEAPGTTRGTAADAGRDGHDAPDAAAQPATHQQLTTGDVERFRVDRVADVRRGVPGRHVRRVGCPGAGAMTDRAGGGPKTGGTGGTGGARDREVGRQRGSARTAWRDDRLWQVGFLVGSALGAAAPSPAGGPSSRPARARRLAAGRAHRGGPAADAPGDADARRSCGPTEPAYAAAMATDRAGALATHSGPSCPGVVERVEVVDRAGWVHANVATFAQLIRTDGGRAARPGRSRRAAARRRRRWRSRTAG